MLGGLTGAALWMIKSWRHRHDDLTRQRIVLAGIGALILTLTVAGFLYLSYRIDVQPQGRYLFAAIAPLALAIVGGWEHLFGLLRLRWVAAPLVVVLLLLVNGIGLVYALAPDHHSRYLNELFSSAKVSGDGQSYTQDNRYLPQLPSSREPAVRSVYLSSPAHVSFVPQQAE